MLVIAKTMQGNFLAGRTWGYGISRPSSRVPRTGFSWILYWTCS